MRPFAGRWFGGFTGDVRPPRYRDAAGASGSGIGDDPDTHTMDIKGTRSRLGVMTRANGGAAEAWTRMAGVCTLPDWDNLPGSVTRLL